MRDVAIVGIGMTPVGEHWATSIRELAYNAFQEALQDSTLNTVDALYVANAFGSTMSSQSHLGALIADHIGLAGTEAYTVEAADASGGVALRTGYLAIASGLVDTIAVIGVEKSSDAIAGGRVQARNIGLDADYETIHGSTLPSLAALLMRRYMYEHNVELSAFEGFSVNAHSNGKLNPKAMFRNQLRAGAFGKAMMVSDPVNLFDGAPDADGAAVVILTSAEKARELSTPTVIISGSAVATDAFKLQDRPEMLTFKSVSLCAQKALAQAEVSIDQVDLLELHDSYTIVTALTLEALGIAEPGHGIDLAQNNGEQLGLNGDYPISTFGGLKSRGNPIGATGVYQAVEATLQLRKQAGDNQVENANIALIQSLGGLASTAVTHILRGT